MTRRHVQISVMTASRGFTMAEVLFAIIVLGIGLILLAAAFPVGIAQVEVNQDRTNANLVARHAYDQLTKVPAAGVRPLALTDDPSSPTVGGWVQSNEPTPLPPNQNYAGKPMTMGLQDAVGVVDRNTWSPPPDLRLKLLYPYDPAFPVTASPQGYSQLGQAIAGNESYLSIWGFRRDDPTLRNPLPPPANPQIDWHENVQWAFPADRRYYWYAFYRQMYERDLPPPAGAWTPADIGAVYHDHITRRTFRVLIVTCKVSGGRTAIRPPLDFQMAYDSGDLTAVPVGDRSLPSWTASYVSQWDNLGPVYLDVNTVQQGSAPESLAGSGIAGLISNGQVRRGGVVVDAWGAVYQIVDFTNTEIRLDRPVPGVFDDALPLWFNPNAIALFPTIVTKQADLP